MYKRSSTCTSSLGSATPLSCCEIHCPGVISKSDERHVGFHIMAPSPSPFWETQLSRSQELPTFCEGLVGSTGVF